MLSFPSHSALAKCLASPSPGSKTTHAPSSAQAIYIATRAIKPYMSYMQCDHVIHACRSYVIPYVYELGNL